MKAKYQALLFSGFKSQLKAKDVVIGRIILYMVIIYLFYQVFESVSAEPKRIWYYAITEMIVLSSSLVAFQVAQEVQSGQIVYFLLRPLPYPLFRFLDSFGHSLARYLILIFLCLGIPFFLTNILPSPLVQILGGFVLGLFGIFLYTLISLLIGLSSFWIEDIKSLVFVNFTATFCFGGLIVPLEFYPTFMRTIALWTPYPWILWLPAGFATGSPIDFRIAFLGITLWIIILILIIKGVYQKCLSSFMKEGE